jgi:hypothetical protein
MDEKLIAAIVGIIFGVVTTYLAAVLKLRGDLRFEYDKGLREKRLERYSELWHLTGLFPKYGREGAVTLADVRALSVNLRDWYFKSGMFLSDPCRDAYFDYQSALSEFLKENTLLPTRLLDDPTYEYFRSLGSDLRTAMVRDVGTRKQPELEKERKARQNQ